MTGEVGGVAACVELRRIEQEAGQLRPLREFPAERLRQVGFQPGPARPIAKQRGGGRHQGVPGQPVSVAVWTRHQRPIRRQRSYAEQAVDAVAGTGGARHPAAHAVPDDVQRLSGMQRMHVFDHGRVILLGPGREADVMVIADRA